MFPQLVLAVVLVRGTELLVETAARKGKQKYNERKARQQSSRRPAQAGRRRSRARAEESSMKNLRPLLGRTSQQLEDDYIFWHHLVFGEAPELLPNGRVELTRKIKLFVSMTIQEELQK